MQKINILMKEITLTSRIMECTADELCPQEKALVEAANKATFRSYSPYSKFSVGAALLLADGTVIPGCNQENAAFGVTICAERSALFAAGAQYPDIPPVAIAISARNEQGCFPDSPISPCGPCRQAMIETETRYNRQLVILLVGREKIYRMEGIKTLMPLSFTDF